MKHLNDEQLDMRIDSFLTRKHQQFPELSLRSYKKQALSTEYSLTAKVFEIMNRYRVIKLAS